MTMDRFVGFPFVLLRVLAICIDYDLPIPLDWMDWTVSRKDVGVRVCWLY